MKISGTKVFQEQSEAETDQLTFLDFINPGVFEITESLLSSIFGVKETIER